MPETGRTVFLRKGAESALRLEPEACEPLYRRAGAERCGGGDEGAELFEAASAALRYAVPHAGEKRCGRKAQERGRRDVRGVLGTVSRHDAAACPRHRGGTQGVGETDAGRARGGGGKHRDVSLHAAVYRPGSYGTEVFADEEFCTQLIIFLSVLSDETFFNCQSLLSDEIFQTLNNLLIYKN